EALINIAVMVGVLPFAGNALPFISYGGSNLVVMLAAMGVLLSISRRSGEDENIQRKTRTGGQPWTLSRGPRNDATTHLGRGNRRGRVSRAVDRASGD
ncbi:MAG: FtsW/RodA/SpoVE family cell cycle protein, partial [Anaerolineales bacterium]